MPHFIAHIFLVQGLFPTIIDVLRIMFLGPAWSLSLEWQFYLVAPLLLYFCAFLGAKLSCRLAVVAGYCAFLDGRLAISNLPAFYRASGLFFAAGIATRFVIRKIPRLSAYPLAAVILGAGFIEMSHFLVPFVIWGAFIAWMVWTSP